MPAPRGKLGYVLDDCIGKDEAMFIAEACNARAHLEGAGDERNEDALASSDIVDPDNDLLRVAGRQPLEGDWPRLPAECDHPHWRCPFCGTREVRGWLGIETAPKGKLILLGHRRYVAYGTWNGLAAYRNGDTRIDDYSKPTHWQLPPSPPTENEDEDGHRTGDNDCVRPGVGDGRNDDVVVAVAPPAPGGMVVCQLCGIRRPSLPDDDLLKWDRTAWANRFSAPQLFPQSEEVMPSERVKSSLQGEGRTRNVAQPPEDSAIPLAAPAPGECYTDGHADYGWCSKHGARWPLLSNWCNAAPSPDNAREGEKDGPELSSDDSRVCVSGSNAPMDAVGLDAAAVTPDNAKLVERCRSMSKLTIGELSKNLGDAAAALEGMEKAYRDLWQLDYERHNHQAGVISELQSALEALRKECEGLKAKAFRVATVAGDQKLELNKAQARLADCEEANCERKEALAKAQARIAELEKAREVLQRHPDIVSYYEGMMEQGQARIQELEQEVERGKSAGCDDLKDDLRKLEKAHNKLYCQYVDLLNDRDAWRAKAEAK